MNVSIRQLRDFVAVATAASFTRAARELRVAQPALTHQIRRLESELGVSVFVRGPRGVTLTADGEQLFEQAERILREYDALNQLAARQRRHAVGSLRVGFMAQGPGELLYEAVRAFRRARPRVEVSLHQFGFEDCFMGITRELTDVAFSMGTLDEHNDIACKSLHEEPMVVAMAADHPLAGRSRLHISEVLEQPFFTDVHPPGKWRDFWDATAYRGGKPPQIISRATTHDEWLEALRLSSGISLCPQSTPSYYPRPGLAFVPLDGVEPIVHWVLWRKETSNRHIDAFVRTVLAIVARELQPIGAPGPLIGHLSAVRSSGHSVRMLPSALSAQSGSWPIFRPNAFGSRCGPASAGRGDGARRAVIAPAEQRGGAGSARVLPFVRSEQPLPGTGGPAPASRAAAWW